MSEHNDERAALDAPMQNDSIVRGLLKEAADSIRAASCEDGISDSRRQYRLALEKRIRAALDAQQPQQPSTTAAEVRALVDEYLGAGGLFNPELMDHEKVRDLIIRMRDMLAPLDAPQPDPRLAAILDSKWRAGDKPDEIVGAWAEDYSTYKIKVPYQLREQLILLQHRAVDASAALDAPQDIPLAISRLNNLEWLLERIDEMHAILCPDRIGTWQQRTEQVRDAVLRLAPKQQPDPREAFEAWADDRLRHKPRLAWHYGDVRDAFEAGFAAGRGSR